MSKIVLIGGIENSGKTILAKEFETKKDFKHFNLDKYFEYVVENQDLVVEYLKKNHKDAYNDLIKRAYEIRHFNKNSILMYYSDKYPENYIRIIETLAEKMMLEEMQKTKKSQNIVLDALLINENSRKYMFDALSSNLRWSYWNCLSNKFNFDKSDKTLIYINENLETCLNRLEFSKESKPYVDEEIIKEHFYSQKIPTPTEQPSVKLKLLNPGFSTSELLEQF